MSDWVVVLLLVVFFGCLGAIAAIIGREVWWQVRAAVEGIREWRAERAWNRQCALIDLPSRDASTASADVASHSPAREPDLDDESWADELHAINQELHGNVITGQFGDQLDHRVWSMFQRQLVPVSEVTHYEVEAVIVRLGHADWLPAAA